MGLLEAEEGLVKGRARHEGRGGEVLRRLAAVNRQLPQKQLVAVRAACAWL